ncbi:hypothetical protein F5146DRAFT_1006027 [Armillaria mellea]|nr:hypothetical protein F5146DRAFT_1006027 [Armillaria mellea]
MYSSTRTMEHEFTYESLNKNPAGLLHKKDIVNSIGPFDGKLGVVIDKEWFMVTPNAHGLYQPPLGINWEMYMQVDFKYGADDPLLWPQFYTRSNPWFSCIQKHPRDLLDCFLPLYKPLTWLRLTVSETQRVAIEMHAVIDYITIYRPHMLVTNVSPSAAADPELIGAFTMDLLRSVFIGASDQTEKYEAFRLFMHNHLRLLNPYALVPGEVHLNPPLPESESSMSTRSKPYDTPNQKTHLKWPNQISQRGLFLSPWNLQAQIVLTVTRKQGWLKQMDTSFHTQISLLLMAHQSWHVILNLDRLMKNASSGDASSSRTLPTKAGKHREQAVNFLQGCASELQIDAHFNLGPAIWRGIELDKLMDDHRREIAWELTELNFRFELLALDAWVATNGGNHDLLLCCLPYGLTTVFVTVDIGSANHGLGHPTWWQRAPYVFPLMNAMRSWRACPNLIQQRKTSYTEAEFDEMEQCITLFYMDSFFHFFGHAPVILHQLSHFPQTLFVPETHKELYMERSGLVFDIAQFSEL